MYAPRTKPLIQTKFDQSVVIDMRLDKGTVGRHLDNSERPLFKGII